MNRVTGWALLLALGVAMTAAGAIPSARAATVMVIEDFAPMRMIPSASSPRKA